MAEPKLAETRGVVSGPYYDIRITLMKATRTLLAAAQGRTPSIHFLGPRHLEAEGTPIHFLILSRTNQSNLIAGSHTPHAHASAPPEYQGDGFQAFLKKLNASWGSNASASTASSSSASPAKASDGKKAGEAKVFAHFWEVPQFSTLRLPDLEEADMEVVMVSIEWLIV